MKQKTFEDLEHFELKEKLQPILDILKEDGGFIAGGFVRWVACGGECEDIDIFTTTNDQYYIIKKRLEVLGFNVKSESDIAVTFEAKAFIPPADAIQVVKPVFGKTPEEVVDTFDFSIVKGWLDPKTELFHINWNMIRDDKNKGLVVENFRAPLNTMLRIIKYSKRGYKIKNLETLTDLFAHWNYLSELEKEGHIEAAYSMVYPKSADELFALDSISF